MTPAISNRSLDAPSAVTTDASEARHPIDLRVNQLRCEVTPLNARHVIVATAVIYFLLTAALVVLP